MFIHNIDPVLLSLGSLQIRYYGLVYFLGFVFLYFFLRYQARKGLIKNLTEEKVETLILYAFIGLMIGARLFTFVFYYPQALLADPLVLFKIWQGGMSFHGGLVGVVVAGYLFSKKHNVKFYSLADLIVIPAAIIVFFGRIANFINAELPGTVTDFALCVEYPNHPIQGCRHPYVIYEGLKNLFIGIGLYFVYKSKVFKEGVVFWGFIFLYALLRFFIDFLREEPLFLGISMGQFLSVTFIIVSVYYLYNYNGLKR